MENFAINSSKQSHWNTALHKIKYSVSYTMLEINTIKTGVWHQGQTKEVAGDRTMPKMMSLTHLDHLRIITELCHCITEEAMRGDHVFGLSKKNLSNGLGENERVGRLGHLCHLGLHLFCQEPICHQFLIHPFKKNQHHHALPHCVSGCLNIIPYRKGHKRLERVFLSLTLTTV